MPFSPDSEVDVTELEDVKEWALLRELEYQGKQDPYTVPVGQHTDFASVPRVFAWFIPPYGRYTKAAILHDYLWRVKAAGGEITWLDADALLRRAMRELGVSFLIRWIMWAAVRWGALTKRNGLRGWWKESWRVLPVTLLAFPFIVPPAVVVGVALLAFYFVEFLFWIPLKLSAVFRTKIGRPPRKEVNRPTISWKL